MRFDDYIRSIKREASTAAEERGRKKGRKKGRKEGELISQIRLVRKKLEKGKELQEIAEELEESEKRIALIREEILSAGEASEKKIANRILKRKEKV